MAGAPFPDIMMNVGPLLLVDDDSDFRDLVCETLSLEGYHALGAASGEIALECLESMHPALILVDVNMPAMSGPEFVQRAKERGSIDPYRVIMLSASAVECASPARWRLTKPIDLDLLLRVVEDFCGTGSLANFWSHGDDARARRTALPARKGGLFRNLLRGGAH
jgi:CheY-like chemotaxis protein